MINKNQKKAQEEMFGFIIIVVLIVVAGLMFLLLQKPQQAELKNNQISNLLYSLISYSSSYENKPLGEAIEECDLCDEECEVCDIVQEELEDIMEIAQKEGGFVVGNQINGYILNSSGYKEIVVQDGELTGNKIGNFVVIQSGLDIIVKLDIYY